MKPQVTPVQANKSPETQPIEDATQTNKNPQADMIAIWRAELARIKQTDEKLAAFLRQKVKPVELNDTHFTLEVLPGLYEPQELMRALKTKGGTYHWHLGKDSTHPTVQEIETQEAEQRKQTALARKDIQKILQSFPDSQILRVDLP